jgi:hypothetical protein
MLLLPLMGYMTTNKSTDAPEWLAMNLQSLQLAC